MKTIGLIGGMSWQSSAHYYTAINTLVANRLGGLHSAAIVMESLDFAPIAAMQDAGDWEQAGVKLAASAKRLQNAGAEIIVLATNTMHRVAPAIETQVGDALLHIADPTAKALIADGAERVGLLGTRFTMEEDFYKARLRKAGLDPIVPEIGHTDLNAIIYAQLCHGIVTEAAHATYVAAIERLAANGAQAVILGCTEIAMLIDDDTSPLPVYDTTQLHAEAAVKAALQ